MTTSQPANTKPKLRWYQYSLRSLLIFVTLFGVVCSCYVVISSLPPKKRHRRWDIDAEVAGRAAIAEYDKNGDGKIEGAELNAVPSLKSSLQQIDRNHDGAISADEITVCIEDWQEKRFDGGPLTCIVTHNQQPLKDANVKFIPEEFFGHVKPHRAVGHTDSDGVAQMNIENPDLPPVVLCGFYRVEITKTGANIPEKYNARTILGIGVLWSDPTFPQAVRFNLE